MDRRRPVTTRATGRIAMTQEDQDGASARGRVNRSAPGDPGDPRSKSFGWSVFSYMIGGMILYGGVGWLVGQWTHIPVLFPVGMIVGLALAITLIIFRVTRS
jgi:ATP synthase protein I